MELTVGELRALTARIECCPEPKSQDVDQGLVRIVVLQRGWVVVGRWNQFGSQVELRNALCVRRWGTTRGLGEIAAGGPNDTTTLDPAGTVRFHELTVVCSFDCDQSKWGAVCK